jgi:hypothetical protein
MQPLTCIAVLAHIGQNSSPGIVLAVNDRQLAQRLVQWQLLDEETQVELDKPFLLDANSTQIGGVIKRFYPEEGEFALRLPYFGSDKTGLIGTFANRASALAWIYTIESALQVAGALPPADWYEVLPE